MLNSCRTRHVARPKRLALVKYRHVARTSQKHYDRGCKPRPAWRHTLYETKLTILPRTPSR